MRLIIVLLSALASTIAFAKELPFYFGADGQYCKMCFKKNFGDNLYSKKSLGLNPFFGINIKDSPFAIEIGYQYCDSSRTSTLTANEYASGVQVPQTLEPITFRSSLKLKGPHVNLFLLTPRYDAYPLQFFGGIGVSHTKATFERATMQYNAFVGKTNRKMEASRSLRRLTLGANYFFTEDFAIRATLVLVNTEKLHAFASDGIQSHFIPEVRPQNSVYYGIGLRWRF